MYPIVNAQFKRWFLLHNTVALRILADPAPFELINRMFLPLRVAGGRGVKLNRHEVRFGGSVRPLGAF